MGRTAILALPAALVVAANWLRLEEPQPTVWRALFLALLGVAPALAPTRRLRLAVIPIALALAVRVAFGVSPLDARPFDSRHDFFGPLLTRLRGGFVDFFNVTLPLDPREQVLVGEIFLLMIFGFCLALGLAIAARRPLAASLVLIAGAGWPATLLPGDSDLTRGGVLLAVLLFVLAGTRSTHQARNVGQALGFGVLVVVCAVAVSTSPALAKGEFIAWQTWDFSARSDRPVNVRYVWNASYGGIRFPPKKTTVLRIKAPRVSLYWRATTLNVFDGNRWLERVGPLVASPARDPLLPARAYDRSRWVEQQVTVEALRDSHFVGASVPVAYDVGGMGSVGYRADGGSVAPFVPAGLSRGDRYTVWSYAPRPTPQQLVRIAPRYPRLLVDQGYLRLQPDSSKTGAVDAPPFRTPGRAARLRSLASDTGVRRYARLYETAQAVAGDTTSPYVAVVALERWFRSQGGFVYDEEPPVGSGGPPLVDFVTVTRRGYCQHFAGAMALMLRYLGIPARVAAGFTSGRYDTGDDEWVVSDHDAHTWVEVWFAGYGWLPFDPTPGQGRLAGSYSGSSRGFDSAALRRILRFGDDPGRRGGRTDPRTSRAENIATSEARDGASARGGPPGGSLLRLLGIGTALVFFAIVLAKLVRRRMRYLTRDPRRLASACREEFVDFVRDQRLDPPRGATLAEVGALVAAKFSVDPARFVGAASTARFGPPERAAEEARRTRGELRTLERQIRRRLSWAERLRGLLSLRSLGFASES